jgi:hypothetical protein
LRRWRPRSLAATALWVAAVVGAITSACAASGTGSDAQNGNGGGSPGQGSNATGGSIVLSSGDGSAGNSGGTLCSDGGCTCIRIASIGHEGIWGACGMYGDGTGAFASWLNTQSTAMVDTYSDTKPTLTSTFLSQYNVIILQWLRDVGDSGSDGPLWQFSQDEVNALGAWVRGGGGLITLSGFDGDGQEVEPLNSLLSFTDFTYNMDGTYGSNCNGCWGGACALTGWNAASPIGAHITQIGIAFGRSISIAPDAGGAPVVDCPCIGGNECAVHEDLGKGHVFAFTDEWVTYTSQWLGTATCISAGCAGNTPAQDFQVPQFWYNAIKYASSAAQCFQIQTPGILQ